MRRKTISVLPPGVCHILLVGNNPIELGKTLDLLSRIPGRRVVTEIAFDLKSTWERLMKFKPNFIVIDDNIGLPELTQTVTSLSANRKTKHIPVTVLKNSNYQQSIVSDHIMDYLLKQNLTVEGLYNSLKNSFRFMNAKKFLYESYRKRKRQLLKLVR